MKPEEFDKAFLAWLGDQTKTEVAGFADWRKRIRGMVQAAGEKEWDDVIAEGTAIRDMYPDYVEAGSAYELLSQAYVATNQKAKAAADPALCAHGRPQSGYTETTRHPPSGGRPEAGSSGYPRAPEPDRPE